MFSLIITLVSIALVAALAIATIFYGGDILKKSKSKALAMALVTQGQQVLGATELFHLHQGRWPASPEELVTFKYLSELPLAPSSIAMADPSGGPIPVTSAFAASAELPWAQVKPYVPQFWLLRTVSEDVCSQVNLRIRGNNGIYNAARHGEQIQCFGTAANYTVLLHQPGNPGDDISVTVPETDPEQTVDDTGGGWAKVPTETTPSNPSTDPVGSVEVRDTTSDAIMSTVDFGDVSKGTTSAPITVKLRNSGTADMVFETSPVTARAPFNVTGTTCPAGGKLAPGQTCSVTLTFSPTTVGAVSDSKYWTVNSNVAGLSLPALRGTGTAPSGDATPIMLIATDTASFDVGPDGSIYLVNNPKSMTKYSPDGQLLLSTPISLAGCSMSGGYGPGYVAVDGAGDVHVAFNCIYSGQTGTEWKSALARYSPNLVFQASTNVSSDSTIRGMTSNGSNYIGIDLYQLSSHKYMGATRISRDYATLGPAQSIGYATTNENGAYYGSGLLMGRNGGFTDYIVTESSFAAPANSVVTAMLNFGGGYLTTKSIQFTFTNGPMAESPVTGQVYAALHFVDQKGVTRNQLVRMTDLVGGNPVVLSTDTGRIYSVRVDSQGCLYTYRTVNGVAGVTRTTSCGF